MRTCDSHVPFSSPEKPYRLGEELCGPGIWKLKKMPNDKDATCKADLATAVTESWRWIDEEYCLSLMVTMAHTARSGTELAHQQALMLIYSLLPPRAMDTGTGQVGPLRHVTRDVARFRRSSGCCCRKRARAPIASGLPTQVPTAPVSLSSP
ncbi:hypothetical protein SRHO_G00265150 [Serrasalmus rhombeus]